MAKFFLTERAIDDLSKIWEYTIETWSERQADIYYNSLISDCGEIAKNPEIGKKYTSVRSDLLGLQSSKHIIFYRVLSKNQIEITRILHQRMDLKNRMTE
ncbi:type II toxin-antitoxin system RelE/ParE family toxin [Marinilongibacter aquaticus]|uniref:type II toxin-antitoxin system RelE/ParE family toxin n=1 Tax=Marinilongibacter aquaticus TaxID=2975157 RepID=UPI0021BD541F|nr:type II toxin-antitoxin system RelE/ParE family toxin [Marinilongibacter aquaticus]UBM59476.1 type II toxin-antitoxin system RelE/ParE family toxin [Marinilongibacter aquaticus]